MPHRDIHNGGLLHHYFENKQVDGLYFSTAIKTFAGSFITIFVPIYLLSLGFTLKDVAFFFLINYLVSFAFFSIGLKLNTKIGVKKVMSLGIILSIVYYLLLNSLSTGNISYWIVAIFLGISGGLYWAGFNLEFSRFCDKNKEASETSFLSIITNLAGAIGPLVGAILIVETSFSLLFILSAGLVFTSIFPLFSTKNEKTKFKFSIKKFIKADNLNKTLAYNTAGVIGVVAGIFWPVFIFLSLGKVLSLGIIISITAVVGVIFLFFVGKLSDKHKKKVLKAGIFSHSSSWITRIFFLTPFGIFINNLYSSFSYSLINLPFAKIIFSKSKESKDSSTYFLYREINLLIGRVIILLFVIFTENLLWTFILSFFITFIYSVLLKEK